MGSDYRLHLWGSSIKSCTPRNFITYLWSCKKHIGFGGFLIGCSIAIWALKRKQRNGSSKSVKGVHRSSTDNRGIPNLGNTCYMNAVLQVLSRTPNFKEKLQQTQLQCCLPWIIPEVLLDSMLSLVEAVQAGTLKPHHPQAVLQAVQQLDDKFEGHAQQDSYHLFNTVLGGLEDLCQPKTSDGYKTDTVRLMNESPISQLFGGVIVTVYTYSTCEDVEPVFQRYTSIPVQIPLLETAYHQRTSSTNDLGLPENGETRTVLPPCGDTAGSNTLALGSNTEEEGQHEPGIQTERSCHCTLKRIREDPTDLEVGLKQWTDVNESEGDLFCRICPSISSTGNSRTDTISRSRIMFASLPPILVLQFNRFNMNMYGQMEKVSRNLTYPELLDMGPFCSTAVKLLNEEYRYQKIVYRLYGVVCHSGTTEGGHYVAHVRPGHHAEEMRDTLLDHQSYLDPETHVAGIQKFWIEQENADKQRGRQAEDNRHIERKDRFLEDEIDDQWFTYNDSWVTECSRIRALSDKDAYILMYERKV